MATFAKILLVMLWCRSAGALKSNGYGLESSLEECLEKGSVHWMGGLVCKCTGECTVGVQFFLHLSLKLTNQKRPKVTILMHH